MKILMVLTSHNKLGETGKKTGFWLEGFAAPYYVFKSAGAAICAASPLGGQPPIDPGSDMPNAQTDATRCFRDDACVQVLLANTRKLRDMKADDFDAVFYPGGHGSLWDLAENAYSMSLLKTSLASGKPIGLVGHGPGVFRHVAASDGSSILNGKSVTGFSNSQEKAAGLTSLVPFLVEDMLTQNGAHYSKVDDWLPFAVTDGFLVTGQNPASSKSTAQALLKVVAATRHALKETA